MSFTAADIAAIKRAIATGALTVRNANGEMVTYRSLSDMREALAMMESEVNPPVAGVVKYITPTFTNGT